MSRSSKAPLTDGQEAFAVEFVRTGNAAAAYRLAYDKDGNSRDDWVYVAACQMLDHPKVSIRIEELKEAAKKRGEYTVMKAMDELEEARILAMREAQSAAAVTAVKEKVKLTGLDKPAKLALTDVDGNPMASLFDAIGAERKQIGKDG